MSLFLEYLEVQNNFQYLEFYSRFDYVGLTFMKVQCSYKIIMSVRTTASCILVFLCVCTQVAF